MLLSFQLKFSNYSAMLKGNRGHAIRWHKSSVIGRKHMHTLDAIRENHDFKTSTSSNPNLFLFLRKVKLPTQTSKLITNNNSAQKEQFYKAEPIIKYSRIE
jgi:hypothetical protein